LGKEGGKVIKQYVTFICDNCGEEYLINDTMEAPPQWLIIKCSIVNTEGYINDEERDQIDHFCSVKCAIQFTENIAFRNGWPCLTNLPIRYPILKEHRRPRMGKPRSSNAISYGLMAKSVAARPADALVGVPCRVASDFRGS
jgi:hypothetical protein